VQNGDISNVVSPRLVIVFEGLIGLLPGPAARAKEQAYRKAKRWSRAANVYEINEQMAKHIWDVYSRTDYSIDVVTYLGDDMAEAFADLMDRESLPIGNTFATTPDQLSRRIAHMPDLAAIYDPDRSNQFKFGSKGRLTDPTTPNLMGRF